MKTNLQILKKIEKLINDELSQAERKEIIELINSDPALQEEYNFRLKIERAIQKEDVMKLRQQLDVIYKEYSKNKNKRRSLIELNNVWYLVAASIIILIGLGYLFTIELGGNESEFSTSKIILADSTRDSDDSNLDVKYTEKRKATKNQSNPSNLDETTNNNVNKSIKSDKNLLAEHYVPSDYFESLMTENRSQQIEIISPKPSEKLNSNKAIIFRWQESIDEKIELIIYNNNEQIILEKFVTNFDYTFNKKIPPGLYYWKLESSEDLIYINKFSIL